MKIDLTRKNIINNYDMRVLEVRDSKRDYSNYDLITFDIETWGLVPENLALGIFYTGTKYEIFYTLEDIKLYLDNLENDTLVYAHNGFNFDYNIFFEDILSRKMKFEQRGGVKFLKYKNKHDKNIIFRDSVYILPGTLKDLGKSFSDGTYKGITPQKFINPSIIGFDRKEYIKDVKKYNIENLDKLDIEYCKDDCLVLYKILHNEEVLKLNYRNFNTIAKIANTKMLNSIDPIVIFNRFDYEFRNMYSGGLTSVFKHEAFGKIGTFDVNSMYPQSMSQFFGKPEKLEEFFYEDKVEEEISNYFEMLKDFPNGKSIVEITLKKNTPKEVIDILKKTPLIPIQKTSYGNIFDGNTYVMEVMNQELSNLLNPLIKDYFEIKPIKSIYCKKENLFYPFREFIEFHYNERLKNKKSKPAYAQILKLIMNSSYGYFAMQQDNSNYIYGSEDGIGKQIEILCYEKGIDVIPYEEYKQESYLFQTADGYEYERNDINDYFYYVKETIGDFEDLQFKTLSAIKYEGEFTEQYVVYYSSQKYIVKDKTSFYIASEITSKSRAYLGKIALEVFFSGNEVCYCDTDSLHIEILNKEGLDNALNKYLDNNQLGMMKNEGIFEYGAWLSKKHYYLFKEVDGKLVMIKDALKGFLANTPIERMIYSQNVISVAKLGSRVKNVSFETNNVGEGKNFLNFVVSRKLDGTFFELTKDNSKDTLKHKKYIKNLYFDILKRGYFAPNEFIKSEELDEIREDIKKVGLIELSRENIENRINFKNSILEDQARIGVFDTLASLKFIPKEEEKVIAREILQIYGNYRLNNRIKKKDNIEYQKKRQNKKNKNFREKQKEVSLQRRNEFLAELANRKDKEV